MIGRKPEVVGVALQSRWEITKASEECAERLPSSPAELSATVRIAAKLAEKLEASSTIISPHSTPSASTTGRPSRLCCKPTSTRESQRQRTGAIRATPLSEDPQYTALRLIVRPGR